MLAPSFCYTGGLPWWLSGEESTRQCRRDMCSLWIRKIPGKRKEEVCSNSCPLSQWCYLTISSSSAPFAFCFQSFPATGSFLMIQFSCLGNPTDRGAWWTTVHGVTKSQTQLSNWACTQVLYRQRWKHLMHSCHICTPSWILSPVENIPHEAWISAAVGSDQPACSLASATYLPY